jgi:hypothetical protein
VNLRKEAKGRECQIRVPGVCNYNPETTVLAHLNGGGMGMKHDDLFGAHSCSSCHDCVDFRVKSEYTRQTLELWHYHAVIRTQQILLDEGLITI